MEVFYSKKFQTADEFIHCLKEYIYCRNNKRTYLTLNESAAMPNSFTDN